MDESRLGYIVIIDNSEILVVYNKRILFFVLYDYCERIVFFFNLFI